MLQKLLVYDKTSVKGHERRVHGNALQNNSSVTLLNHTKATCYKYSGVFLQLLAQGYCFTRSPEVPGP